jgi:hypothetical protein
MHEHVASGSFLMMVVVAPIEICRVLDHIFVFFQKLLHMHVHIVGGTFVSDCPLQTKWPKTTFKTFGEVITRANTGLSRPNW